MNQGALPARSPFGPETPKWRRMMFVVTRRREYRTTPYCVLYNVLVFVCEKDLHT